MTVKELRIGNYVFDLKNNIIQVESVYYTGINISGGGAGDWAGSIDTDIDESEMFGIQLTPEILEKCGFRVAYTGAGYFKHENMYGPFALNDNCFNLQDYEGHNILSEPIYYLHQLQNLYFALTGKELEINL